MPAVLGADESTLVIELLPPGEPTLGRGPRVRRGAGQNARRRRARVRGAVARVHRVAAARQHPARQHPARQRPARQRAHRPVDTAGEPDWGSWYAERRLAPYLKRARDAGALSAADARPVEAVIDRIGELAGPPEPPSRIHGDLWAGNVLWPGGRGALIDPAAHGGHRETDLAMLALFGAPYLDEILRAYDATVPLADGWRSRVPLHQLHPLLVHACLFGAGYVPQVTAAARQALRV